jgi:hypothetical protein
VKSPTSSELLLTPLGLAPADRRGSLRDRIVKHRMMSAPRNLFSADGRDLSTLGSTEHFSFMLA